MLIVKMAYISTSPVSIVGQQSYRMASISLMDIGDAIIPIRADKRTCKTVWAKRFIASPNAQLQHFLEAILEAQENGEPFPGFSIPAVCKPTLRRVIHLVMPSDRAWVPEWEDRVYTPIQVEKRSMNLLIGGVSRSVHEDMDSEVGTSAKLD